MPKYTVHYFDMRARGEPVRLILKYGNLEFEDHRFGVQEWFAGLKAASPLGKCPALEVDGVKITQTVAICKFLAKRTGLYGDGNDLTEAMIDMYAGGVEDCWVQLQPYYVATFIMKDPEKAKALFAEAKEFQPQLQMWNQVLANSTSGFLVGDKPSYADVMLYNLVDVFHHIDQGIVAPHDHVMKHLEKVGNLPGIKEYVATRKHTDG